MLYHTFKIIHYIYDDQTSDFIRSVWLCVWGISIYLYYYYSMEYEQKHTIIIQSNARCVRFSLALTMI